MSRLIDTGLEQLTNMVFRMGELAYKTVSLSLGSYINGVNAYEQVQNLSDMLVTMADKAEDKVFELIARFQPVASDLRIIKSYMKITYDFTRYGRYALDVSQIYARLGGLKECEDWIKQFIREMSEKVLSMVHTSVYSLKSHDINLAKTLSETEKQVDSCILNISTDWLTKHQPQTGAQSQACL